VMLPSKSRKPVRLPPGLARPARRTGTGTGCYQDSDRFPAGLRAAELCDLRWDQVEFGAAVLHVHRVKNGTPSTHPLRGDELRALRRLPFVFVRLRGGGRFL
jgi:integrase